jgi:class 3 adenylate cyclase/predicted ATPase
MQDIAEWLGRLGMSEYAPRFAENRIDFSVLRDLTDQDLKELGIVLGDRRKLLRAIGELREPEPEQFDKPAEAATAERRQLTVMFCDLVGSTSLSTRLDPEDLRDIIGAYHRRSAEIIQQNGGFVAKYMGDGVLAYFGYPEARENDAERAVQAGLDLVAAAPNLSTPSGTPLQIRIGIATGLVVVGDLTGSGEAQERGIVGDTPNLAARLQGVAEPNMVVIAEGTRRLIGNLFELRDLGSRGLKGIAGPVPAWEAVRANVVESRFDALRTGPVELVGREEELDRILRCWARAKGGEGGVVLLSGEAGIGKSGLTAKLLGKTVAEPQVRIRTFCSPQHTDSAFYPIIGHMERAAGLAREDSAKARLDKLDAMFTETATSLQDVGLFAEMMSLPSDGRYQMPNLTPQQRRQRTLEALPAQIEALARINPVMMIFEDVHWIDPTSLEVLDRIIARIASHRILLILTFRPEFRPHWPAQPYVVPINISRLAARDVETMIGHLAGNRSLPAGLRQDIVERADGIPLFIEEMTKAVLEAGGDHQARRVVAAVPSPVVAVPDSLHASLMSRLDRLGSAKAVAQIGAAIGREFSHALLASVAGKSEAELNAALERLVAAGLLFRQGVAPNATYQFNHALVQDAAYGALLRDQRRAIHARIAETLEVQFAEIADSRPELLARHTTQAGLPDKAAVLWAKAGRRSLARSALIEAAEQLSRALAQLALLPRTRSVRHEQIKIQIDLSNALIHTKGHASPETKASFQTARSWVEEAEAAGEAVDDPLVLFSVLYGFWVGNRMAFKGDVANDLARQFYDLAEAHGATVPRMIAHLIMGISLALVGNSADGRTHLDQVVAMYEPSQHRSLATRFGHDVRMTAYSWRALALWMLGCADGAADDVRRALEDAHEIEHAATSMFALSHGSLAHVLRRDAASAAKLADDLVALAQEKGSLYWKSYGLMLQAWLMADGGAVAEAIPNVISATDAMRSTGATAYAPWYLAFLAQAHADRGELAEARRRIAEALAIAETTGETWCEADIHRIAGEIALAPPDRNPETAEAHFERALRVARQQKATSFELRAATAIARLRHDSGRGREGRDLLGDVLGRFTEGFGTRDLIEAKTLLDMLPQS